MQTIRIFISSPGDVQEERDKARNVVAELQRTFEDHAILVPVLWEDLPIPATASFQEGIDFVLSTRHRIDIAVFILWSRLGSALGASIRKADGSPYHSGTEREFDLMLHAYEQSGRKTPLILAYTRRDEDAFNERLDARKLGDDSLEEILRQRKLARRFIRENFVDADGRNLRAYHSYKEPVGFAQRLLVHLRDAIGDSLSLDSSVAVWNSEPYRSLEVFDTEHAPIFCGRDEETCELLQRLRDQRAGGAAFACIVGSSGSGKSSLARAGVAAALLRQSFDEEVREWRPVVMVPSLAAGPLLPALAESLATAVPAFRDLPGGPERLAGTLAQRNGEATAILLDTAFKATSDQACGSVRALLVIDQLEELWTLKKEITAEEIETFLLALETLARSGHTAVLATLRSDFYPTAQLSPAFLRMKGDRGHFDLVPPGPAALQDLIVKPAHRSGLRFERIGATGRSLDETILEEAARDPSALPLLQYALAELYEHRDQSARLLTFSAYREIGGVEGALAQRASSILAGLPDEAESILEEIFPLLVSVDIAGEKHAVRRRARLVELTSTPAREQLVSHLIRARFLSTDRAGEVSVASITHESLLRRWPRLSAWITKNADFLQTRARIEARMREDSPLLKGDPLLDTAKAFLATHGSSFAADQSEWISRAVATAEAKERQAIRRQRIAFVALTLLSIAALSGGVYAWSKEREARSASRQVKVLLESEQKARGRESRSRAEADCDLAGREMKSGGLLDALPFIASSLKADPTYEPSRVTAAFALASKAARSLPLSNRIESVQETEMGTLLIDGSHRYALSYNRTEVILREVTTWREIRRCRVPAGVVWARFDRETAVVLDEEGTLHLRDPQDPARDESFQVGENVLDVHFNRDRSAGAAIVKEVAAAKTEALSDRPVAEEVLRLIHRKDREMAIHPIKEAGGVSRVEITPDGRYAIAAMTRPKGYEDSLKIFEIATGKCAHEQSVDDVSKATWVARVDGQLLTCTPERLLGIDLAKQGKEWLHEPFGFRAAGSLSPDGLWAILPRDDSPDRILVSLTRVGDDGEDRVQQRSPGFRDGREVAFIKALQHHAFLPDGSALATTSADDQKVSIWPLDAQARYLRPDFSKDHAGVVWLGTSPACPRSVLLATSDDDIAILSPNAEGTWDIAEQLQDRKFQSQRRWLLPVGDRAGMAAVAGARAETWDGVSYSSAQLWLREREPILDVWFADGVWLTATANRVTWWQAEVPAADLPKPADDGIGRNVSNLGGKVAHVFGDGTLLWQKSEKYATEWGLAEPGGEFVTFGPIRVKPSDEQGSWAACTRDGSRFFILSEGEGIQGWDVRSGKSVGEIKLPPGARAIVLDPERAVALLAEPSGALAEFDLGTGTALPSFSRLPKTISAASIAGATSLPGGTGWWLVAQRGERYAFLHSDSTTQVARVLGEPASAPSSVPDLKVSSSGRFLMAHRYDWFWCYDRLDDRLVLEGTAPDWWSSFNPVGFDPRERYFGNLASADDDSPVLDLSRREFISVPGGLNLAGPAAAAEPPAWLTPLLASLAGLPSQPVTSRLELASRIGYVPDADDIFTRLALPWLTASPAPEEPTEEDSGEQDKDWALAALEEKRTKEPANPLCHHALFLHHVSRNAWHDASASLAEMRRLYELRLAAGRLPPWHAAYYGKVLLHHGEFQAAESMLAEAEERFPFHVTHATTDTAGEMLRKCRALAIWLSGKQEEAAAYAGRHHIYQSYDHPRPLPIFRGDTPAELNWSERDLMESITGGLTGADPPPEREEETASYGDLLGSARTHLAARTPASLELAQKLLEEAEKQDPGTLEIALLLAKVHHAQKRPELASEVLNRCENAAIAEGGVDLARLRQAQNRLPEALDAWKKIARSGIPRWEILFEAAAAARQTGDYETALGFLDEMRRRGSNNRGTSSSVLSGWLHWEAGRSELAEEEWLMAEEIYHDPLREKIDESARHDFTRRDWLAGLAAGSANDDPEAALEWHRELLLEMPSLGAPAGFDGEITRGIYDTEDQAILDHPPLARLDEIRRSLKELHAKLPADERTASHAAALLADNRPAEARTLLDSNTAQFPGSPWIAYQQASLATRSGDHVGAADAWLKALSRWEEVDREVRHGGIGLLDREDLSLRIPNHAGRPSQEILLTAIACSIDAGESKRASEMMDLGRMLRPRSFTAGNQRGWLQLATGAPEAASESFEEVSATAHEQMARLSFLASKEGLESTDAEAKAGAALADLLSHQDSPTLKDWLAIRSVLGNSKEDWKNKLAGWSAPAAILEKLYPFFDVAAGLPPETVANSVPAGEALAILRALGHGTEAARLELELPDTSPERSAELLLELDTPSDTEAAIRLLMGIKDSPPVLGHHLALAHALQKADRQKEALDLMTGLIVSPQRHDKLTGISDNSVGAKDAVELVVNLARELGEPEAALKVVEQAPAIWRVEPWARLGAGWLAWMQGNHPKARRDFEFAEQICNFDDAATLSECRVGRAVSCWKSGDRGAAFTAYQEYVSADAGRASRDHLPEQVPAAVAAALSEVREEFAKLDSSEMRRRWVGERHDFQAEYFMGRVLGMLGRTEDSIGIYREALDTVADHDEDLRHMTLFHLANHLRTRATTPPEFQDAEAVARQAVDISPGCESCLPEWIACLAALEKQDAVAGAFKQLLATTCSAETVVAAFEDVYAAGGLELTRKVLAESTPQRRDQLMIRWSGMHVTNGDFAGALKLFEESAKEAPEAWQFNLAVAKAGLGRHAEALEHYLDYLVYAPQQSAQSAEDYEGEWKRLFTQLQDAARAAPVKSFEERVERREDPRTARQNASEALGNLGRWKESIAVARRLLDGVESDVEGTEWSVLLASRCLYKLDPPDPTAAMGYLENPQWTVAGSDPDDVKKWVFSYWSSANVTHLPRRALDLGNPDAARKICTWIASSESIGPDACDSLGYIFELLGDSRAADEAYEEATRRFGFHRSLVLHRALVLFNRRDAKGSLSLLDRLRSLDFLDHEFPGETERLVRSGALWLLDRKDEAVVEFRAAIEAEPANATPGNFVDRPGDDLLWPPVEQEIFTKIQAETLKRHPELKK